MTFTAKIAIYVAIAVAIGGGYAAWHYKVKDSGKQEVIIEQEKKLNTIKDKTNAAKTEVLTAPVSTVNDELLKYARPDE